MLVIATELRPSTIHGVGVFLLTNIKKGDLIWRFDSRVDRVYSPADIAALPALARTFTETYGMWNAATDLWVMCGDNGRFFNHSDKPNTHSLGTAFADDVALHDLAAGTELTSDYSTICDTIWTPGEKP